jgi:hypothetical protein
VCHLEQPVNQFAGRRFAPVCCFRDGQC